MKMLGFALLFAVSSSFAATPGYEVKMDVMVNGKKLTSPKILVKKGEAVTFIQKSGNEERFVEIEAIESELFDQGVKMKMKVGTIAPDGTRTILSRPEVLAEENKRATISSESELGGEDVSVSVLAKKKIL